MKLSRRFQPMNVSRLENSDLFEQYSFLKHRIRRDEESVESERVRIHFVRNVDGTIAFVGSVEISETSKSWTKSARSDVQDD